MAIQRASPFERLRCPSQLPGKAELKVFFDNYGEVVSVKARRKSYYYHYYYYYYY